MLFFVFIIGIALDQTIECTINKYGKSHGGINGRLSENAINQWIDSFAFRALASTVMHELCDIETVQNSVDSHVECRVKRREIDATDLNMIIESLRREDLFTMKNAYCRKLRSGLVFHEEIVDSICSLHERGLEAMGKYINERLIETTAKVDIDAPLKALPRLR